VHRALSASTTLRVLGWISAVIAAHSAPSVYFIQAWPEASIYYRVVSNGFFKDTKTKFTVSSARHSLRLWLGESLDGDITGAP
jgi:hypothetical protein